MSVRPSRSRPERDGDTALESSAEADHRSAAAVGPGADGARRHREAEPRPRRRVGRRAPPLCFRGGPPAGHRRTSKISFPSRSSRCWGGKEAVLAARLLSVATRGLAAAARNEPRHGRQDGRLPCVRHMRSTAPSTDGLELLLPPRGWVFGRGCWGFEGLLSPDRLSMGLVAGAPSFGEAGDDEKASSRPVSSTVRAWRTRGALGAESLTSQVSVRSMTRRSRRGGAP